MSPSLESPQKRLFLALKGIKKTDQLSETEICTNSLYFQIYSLFKIEKSLEEIEFLPLTLLEHVKVSSSITKMK